MAWRMAMAGWIGIMGFALAAGGQVTSEAAATPAEAADCLSLLTAHDARSVEACRVEVARAEAAPANEVMARMVAHDQYGLALLAFAHKPKEALTQFDREIALMPKSTVEPDSMQWAVAYWHRATAHQQMGNSEKAIADLKEAESSFTKAIAAAGENLGKAAHLTELRQRVVAQHAAILEKMGRHAEAQKLLDGNK